MGLVVGARLGPYEILSLIGVGGMGEVYEARDTRLGRVVALKVLPEHVATDPERRRRFEHEARAVSALNHPHICVLYDIGSTGSPQSASGGAVDYLVMEYLEGQTLAERLAKGPLKVEQALEYGAQIAEALAAAHRQGIVHRDLKPANVMITKTGVKLLDFGLARLTERTARELGATASATLSGVGTIVGTVPYMAPEQVQGLATDARTDIFAFGYVLYEMLTGRRAFDGGTPASVAAAILEREPAALASLAPLTPPSLDRIVNKCLSKDPEARWQSAADASDELRWVATQQELNKAPVHRGRRAYLPRWLATAFVGVLMLAAGAWWGSKFVRPASSTGAQHYELRVSPAEGLRGSQHQREVLWHAGRPSRLALAISPDSRWLVYSGYQDGRQSLYRYDIATGHAGPIANTEGAEWPFFKPDGSRIGFWAGGAIRSVDVGGGSPQMICETEPLYGVTWSDDGSIVFAKRNGPLWRVPADGGTPKEATRRREGEGAHTLPSMLPGGHVVLFNAGDVIVAEDLASHARWELLKSDAARGEVRDARFVAPGYLIYARRGAVEAVGFDVENRRITSTPVILVADVMQSDGGLSEDLNTHVMQVATSATGNMFYLSGGAVPFATSKLVWLDLSGRVVRVEHPDYGVGSARFSPNGRRLAVSTWNSTYGHARIRILDPVAGTALPISPISGDASSPVWMGDDRLALSYGGADESTENLHVMPADGSAAPQRMTPKDVRQVPQCSTTDGGLLFARGPIGNRQLCVLDGKARRQEVIASDDDLLGCAVVSRDGRWVAYQAGRFVETDTQAPRDLHVMVRGLSSRSGAVRVSPEDGASPVWSPDGHVLYYTRTRRDGSTNKQTMVAVDMADGRPVPGRPQKELFSGSWSLQFPTRSYDLSPDGKDFLFPVDEPVPPQVVSRINVVLNWVEELKAHVQPGK